MGIEFVAYWYTGCHHLCGGSTMKIEYDCLFCTRLIQLRLWRAPCTPGHLSIEYQNKLVYAIVQR